MITDAKLTVYQKYGGDIDGWARAGTPVEKALMIDADWTEISEILFRLAIVKSGQATAGYEAETRRMIAAAVENESVAQRLNDYA